MMSNTTEVKETTNKRPYLIYSISMVNWLVRNGNDIISVEDSPLDRKGRKKVFSFEDTEKLRKDMSMFRKD